MADDPHLSTDQRAARANRVVMLCCAGVFFGMIGLAYASVPLYRIFCQVTGDGGTTQKVESAEGIKVVDRPIKVRFDGNVGAGLKWSFKPNQTEVTLKLGEVATTSFHVRNNESHPVSATAAFNVTPESMGAYFSKLNCFCFSEQTLQPGEEADLSVTFYVDPAMLDDINSSSLHAVTLSYTFFPDEKPNKPVAAAEPLPGASKPL